MRQPFPSYAPCPVCGDPAVNPGTLAIRWWWDGESGRVTGRFLPAPAHAGYGDQLHGGILLALFDEALAWAAAAAKGSFCSTGELTTRFRRPIPIGFPIQLVAWASEARGPYVRARGQAVDEAGEVLATARGTYAAMDRARALELNAALQPAPEEVDVLAGPLTHP